MDNVILIAFAVLVALAFISFIALTHDIDAINEALKELYKRIGELENKE